MDDLDGIAEVFQASEEAVGLDSFGGLVEVVEAEVVVEGSVFEHGAHGFLGATAGTQAMELGLQIAAVLAGGGPRALNEGHLQPGCAFAHAIGAALAGALVVSRRHRASAYFCSGQNAMRST